MFAGQASAFLRAVSGAGPGDLATFDEGAFAVALCDAARKSSAARREEQIPDWRNS
jgi:predicted dehydrogenase